MTNVIDFPSRVNMTDYRPGKRVECALDVMEDFFTIPAMDELLEHENIRLHGLLRQERRISKQYLKSANEAHKQLNAFKASWVFKVWQFFNRRK